MTGEINLTRLQEALEQANKVTKIKSKVQELHSAIDQIVRLRGELTALLEGRSRMGRQGRPRRGRRARKAAFPKTGSGPEKLCKVMGKNPMPVDAIAKKTGLSEATVRVYLGQFACFSNVRGKGYTCSHTVASSGPKAKTTRKRKKAKAKSKTKTKKS